MNRDLVIAAIIIVTAIVLNRLNIVSGFFLGFIYGVGISLLLRTVTIKIRKK